MGSYYQDIGYFKGKVGEKLRLKRRLRVGEDDLREWLEKRKIGKEREGF